MGAGVSMTEKRLNDQEKFVHNNFKTAKKNMSVYKRDNHNRYNDTQIKMKLREEYYNPSHNNKFSKETGYIANIDWKTWNN
jgi:hypothetical protein